MAEGDPELGPILIRASDLAIPSMPSFEWN
jgi:hypothetical protein